MRNPQQQQKKQKDTRISKFDGTSARKSLDDQSAGCEKAAQGEKERLTRKKKDSKSPHPNRELGRVHTITLHRNHFCDICRCIHHKKINAYIPKMTIALSGQRPGSSIDDLLNDITQYVAETRLFCAKKRDDVAAIKHDFRRKKEEQLRRALSYLPVCCLLICTQKRTLRTQNNTGLLQGQSSPN